MWENQFLQAMLELQADPEFRAMCAALDEQAIEHMDARHSTGPEYLTTREADKKRTWDNSVTRSARWYEKSL